MNCLVGGSAIRHSSSEHRVPHSATMGIPKIETMCIGEEAKISIESEEIWGKVNLYKILLQFPNILLLVSFLSSFWPFSIVNSLKD